MEKRKRQKLFGPKERRKKELERREQIDEILRQQLQLLSEASKECLFTEELTSISEIMLSIAYYYSKFF